MAEDPREGRRRIVRRRGSGVSFGGGGLSQSSTGMGRVGEDDYDDEGYTEDLNAQVAAQVGAPSRAVHSTPGAPPNRDDPQYTPANRLAEVGTRSPEYAIQYRQQLLLRLMMRNIPLDEIASQLGISIRQVQRDMAAIKDRMRQYAKELEIDVMIGNSANFYDEIQALSLRIADSSSTPTPMRLAAMRVSLASHNDKQRFFQAAGVFDILKFRKHQDGSAATDIQRLMSTTEELLREAKESRRAQDTEAARNVLGDFTAADGEIVDL